MKIEIEYNKEVLKFSSYKKAFLWAKGKGLKCLESGQKHFSVNCNLLVFKQNDSSELLVRRVV